MWHIVNKKKFNKFESQTDGNSQQKYLYLRENLLQPILFYDIWYFIDILGYSI